MFERFTESARRAIFLCRLEAMQRGASEISTADLFLAILNNPANTEPLASSLHPRAAEFRQILAGSNPTAGPDPNLPFSADSKRALALAAGRAESEHSPGITRDHLLHGILQANDSTARKVRASGL